MRSLSSILRMEQPNAASDESRKRPAKYRCPLPVTFGVRLSVTCPSAWALRGLLHHEEPHAHAALGGHVPPAAVFHEVAVAAKPREQAVLPDVDAVRCQQLRQLANQHGVVGCRHRVGEQRLRRKLAVLGLKLLALGALLLEVGGKADDGVGVGQYLLHLLGREVAAMSADGWQDVGVNP